MRTSKEKNRSLELNLFVLAKLTCSVPVSVSKGNPEAPHRIVVEGNVRIFVIKYQYHRMVQSADTLR